MPRSTRTRRRAPEPRPERGLVDTSVVIGLESLDRASLPGELAISTVTLAELAAGPHATEDAEERARRQERLQRTEATFDALPFDDSCARAYGRVYSAVTNTGRKARGPRVLDLLIAATAAAHELPLYTLNPDDLRGLDALLEVVAVAAGPAGSES